MSEKNNDLTHSIEIQNISAFRIGRLQQRSSGNIINSQRPLARATRHPIWHENISIDVGERGRGIIGKNGAGKHPAQIL